MTFDYFSRNGQILPIAEAVVPLDNLEYSYGFGVYETIRVSKGVIYFLEQHAQRLLKSAEIIGLSHKLTLTDIESTTAKLVEKLGNGTYNLKLLLIGGAEPKGCLFTIMASNPLFPNRQLYANGAKLITAHYERAWPQAKTLNMLGSYLAYRQARQEQAYDALLVNGEGQVTEGTRTNFFVMRGKTIISPPADDILLGVMRSVVLQVAREHGYTVEEHPILLAELGKYDGAFVTSTSSKVMPIRHVDAIEFGPPKEPLKNLMTLCNQFLSSCNGKLTLMK